MDKHDVEIEPTEHGLLVKGEKFLKGDDGAAWEAVNLDKKRVVLLTKESRRDVPGIRNGFTRCSVEIMESYLLGLVGRKFSGTLSVDNGRGVKRLYFSHGELVFAASNMIDDRLGEVMYRNNLINLENLMNFTVQVSNDRRFGRVLLESDQYRAVDLWEALSLQVAAIFKSIFAVNNVFFTISEEFDLPMTMVRFSRSTDQMVREFAGFGRMFRAFLRRITPETVVKLSEYGREISSSKVGTFEADFLSLVDANRTISAIVGASKLTDINTFYSIFSSVIKKTMITASADKNLAVPKVNQQALQLRIDRFKAVRQLAHDKCGEVGVGFPIHDLLEFIAKHGVSGTDIVYLDGQGDLPVDCLINLANMCYMSESVSEKVGALLDGMSTFLFQVVSDLVPRGSLGALRSDFEKIFALDRE